MKLNNLLATLLFSLCILLISSYNDDEFLTPISLKDMDTPDIKLIYPASSAYTEGTFKITSATIRNPGIGEHEYHSYELTLPEEQRIFMLWVYQPSGRTGMIPITTFYEDVKNRFITDYPLVERVHTAQVLTLSSNLFY